MPMSLKSRLDSLRRRPLLVRAARILAESMPDPDALARRAGVRAGRGLEARLEALLQAEARLEAARRAGAAHYQSVRQIEALAAIMLLAPQLPARRPATARIPCPGARRGAADRPAQAKTSGSSALRRATKSRSASSVAGSMAGF